MPRLQSKNCFKFYHIYNYNANINSSVVTGVCNECYTYLWRQQVKTAFWVSYARYKDSEGQRNENKQTNTNKQTNKQDLALGRNVWFPRHLLLYIYKQIFFRSSSNLLVHRNYFFKPHIRLTLSLHSLVKLFSFPFNSAHSAPSIPRPPTNLVHRLSSSLPPRSRVWAADGLACVCVVPHWAWNWASPVGVHDARKAVETDCWSRGLDKGLVIGGNWEWAIVG